MKTPLKTPHSCGQEGPNYFICNRPEGHKGPHVAISGNLEDTIDAVKEIWIDEEVKAINKKSLWFEI